MKFSLFFFFTLCSVRWFSSLFVRLCLYACPFYFWFGDLWNKVRAGLWLSGVDVGSAQQYIYHLSAKVASLEHHARCEIRNATNKFSHIVWQHFAICSFSSGKKLLWNGTFFVFFFFLFWLSELKSLSCSLFDELNDWVIQYDPSS